MGSGLGKGKGLGTGTCYLYSLPTGRGQHLTGAKEKSNARLAWLGGGKTTCMLRCVCVCVFMLGVDSFVSLQLFGLKGSSFSHG